MHRIDTILFDLDGSLLPMDQDEFIKRYMGALGRTFAPSGYDPKQLTSSVWKGTEAMVRNDGTMSNRERFWNVFSQVMGREMLSEEPVFEQFYREQFGEAKAATVFQPLAGETVRIFREKGYTVILATNPLFPSVATRRRMEWAGLSPEDFDLVTTYEEETFCKPNLKYYISILERFGKMPEQCMMVGNDVDEDMCVTSLGIKGYLLTDCLLNRHGRPLEGYLSGSFEEFRRFAEKMPSLS
ncbi:HAD family hydrolase [Qiania dongpingensis]|uniref:HAD family hydrolase n=1 Tax=Qiania dongpingensis TaxID=2763669 RepID=A0A7G9G480_9FIRM|nr:HAD family hydrolase [Qiania dongpingensis]QNM05612.1 HAD family hydrolase [Qiania dongpingensis]